MAKSSRHRSRLILVLGGASSGKSQVALDLAGPAPRRAFVATGQALDREMASRIERHRATRASDWATAEVPVELTKWISSDGHKYQVVVIDCLTLWLSNVQGRKTVRRLSEVVSGLLQAIRGIPATVVIVSNELGMGLVPVNAAARTFRDMAGKVNQQVAAEADEVHFVVSGLSLRLK